MHIFSMETIGERIIAFYRAIDFTGILPLGISVMNPYKNNPGVMKVVEEFYKKFYSDNNPRYIIFVINPGRFGAGVTGITFTDTVRLREICGIDFPGAETREISSVFVYKMINRFGGPGKFYSRFFIGAVSPLGFTMKNKNGREVNFNYYDKPELLNAAYNFIYTSIKKQVDLGIISDICFCLGTGKNFRFLSAINEKHSWFNKIVPLEHPRFIMQYRRKKADLFIKKYLKILKGFK